MSEAEAHLCPVRAIARWIECAGKDDGPLFRKMNSGDRVSDEPLVSSIPEILTHSLFYPDIREIPRVVSALPGRCRRLPVPIRNALFSPRRMPIPIHLSPMGTPKNRGLGWLVNRVQLGDDCHLSDKLVGQRNSRAGKLPPAGDAACSGVCCMRAQLRLWGRLLS